MVNSSDYSRAAGSRNLAPVRRLISNCARPRHLGSGPNRPTPGGRWPGRHRLAGKMARRSVTGPDEDGRAAAKWDPSASIAACWRNRP